MKTSTDLKSEFSKETGLQFELNKQQYFEYIEEKYLEKLNEEGLINRIFTDE